MILPKFCLAHIGQGFAPKRFILLPALSVVLSLALGVPPALAKYASVVMDARTGEIRHSINGDTRNFPASLTKLMTLYMLFEALDSKKLTMDSRLTVSRRAAGRPASKLGLAPGSSIRVRDAINALIVKSANDVATVVAENLAGDEKKFALRMTAKARRLGMTRTTFRNASGLPHGGQMSTAKDMATLTRQMISRFPHYYPLFGQEVFRWRGQSYRTHNKVLKSYPGAEGMKTGYIRASGYNLITTAKRQDRRLIGVVFGGNTPRARDGQMKKLLNRVFGAYEREDNLAVNFQPTRKPDPSNALIADVGTSAGAQNVAANREADLDDDGPIWGIQVGAFYSAGPAREIAEKISKQYARILKDAEIHIMPLKKRRNRVLYRARLLGMDKAETYRACRILRGNNQPCLELKLERAVELAQR